MEDKGIDVMVLKRFMDDHDVSFEEMRSLLAEVSPPDLTINNVINLMESKPYFEEDEDYQERDMKYTPPDKTKGPSRVIDGFDVSPEELQKLVDEKKNKPDKDMYEKYSHNNVEVWVRKDLKGKHREHCLCWNCIKFCPKPYLPVGEIRVDEGEIKTEIHSPRPEKDEDNCPRAQELYEYCCKYGMVTPVWECPDFEDLSETAEAFDIPVTGEYFEDGFEDGNEDEGKRNERSEIS